MSREDEMKAQHLQYLEGRRPDFVSMIMNLNEYKNKGMTAKEYKQALNSMKKNYDMPDYFLGSVIDSGNAAYMESRKAKMEGSLMVPREGYGLGSKVIKAAKNLIQAKGRFNKRSEDQKNALFDINLEDLTEKEFDELMTQVLLEPEEVIELESKFNRNYQSKKYGDLNKSELEYLFTVNPLQESGSEKYDRIESEISFGDILPSPRKNKAKGSLMTPREGYAEGSFKGISPEEHIGAAFQLLEAGEYNSREAIAHAATQLSKAKNLRQLDRMKDQIETRALKYRFPNELKQKIKDFNVGDSSYEFFGKFLYGEDSRDSKAEGTLVGGQKKLDINKDGKISGEDFSLLRDRKEKGGMPVDTYPNIPPEEMAEAMASQLPDDEMEEEYIKYVMDESLNDEEQDYLAEALTKDPKLSDIMDKVITTAGEFSGAGEVDGPGTGVSDSIPARLSDGEFVFTKKATDQIGADQLQRMMDDAERAYDGGVQQLNVGGMPRKDEEDLEEGKYDMSKTDEEIRKLMIGANKMPSVQ